MLGLEGNVIASGRYDGSHAGEYGIYSKDGRGSTTSILLPDGSCTASYEYTDFGETIINGDRTFENEICYTGGVYDETTGLYYLNARYYNPADGRFLSQDTYRGEADSFKTWHLYAYCANNPVNYTDPSGHEAITSVLLVILVGGLATSTVSVLFSQWKNMSHSYYHGRTIVSFKYISSYVAPKTNTSRGGYAPRPRQFDTGKPNTIPKVKSSGTNIKITPKVRAIPKHGGIRKTKIKKSVITRITNKEADAAAKKLGYTKLKTRIKGKPIYKKGHKYISPDADEHGGGFWKLADSIKELGRRDARTGTYNKDLTKRIKG